MKRWNITEHVPHNSFWMDSPSGDGRTLRLNVSYNEANTFGSVAGQILREPGWYWYTADFQGNKFSSMFGPFSNPAAALADCEVANRVKNEAE